MSALGESAAPPTVTEVETGDVLELHALPENEGALFQAASQFNCLEMGTPSAVPEDGVRIYATDNTQGPACALACACRTYMLHRFWNALLTAFSACDADRSLPSTASSICVQSLWIAWRSEGGTMAVAFSSADGSQLKPSSAASGSPAVGIGAADSGSSNDQTEPRTEEPLSLVLAAVVRLRGAAGGSPRYQQRVSLSLDL